MGPHALGDRSIICDPRNPNMKQILNQRIKRHESFRPFAQAIHREAVSEYFETDYDVPFMLQVFNVRSNMRKRIPAVTHIDYSARVQSVNKDKNERFWKLLNTFKKKTGYSILVNTSFNIRGEPIVCTPDDAYKCFKKTEMDYRFLKQPALDRLI